MYNKTKINGITNSRTGNDSNLIFMVILSPQFEYCKCFKLCFRYIWLTIVLTVVTLFIVQVSLRVIDYLDYNASINMNVVYEDQLDFPAVTICNQNKFR